MNSAPIAYSRRSSGLARWSRTVRTRTRGRSEPGVKCFGAGSSSRKATAHATATRPITPTATRQPHSWATQPVMIRPLIPPTLLPATNRPIAVTSARGRTSSARYAVAEAGSPASAAPCTARSATSAGSEGAKGTSSPTVTARASEAVMTVRRPNRSDSALIGSTNTARPPVAAATVQLASLAVTPRSPEISGSRAWVE